MRRTLLSTVAILGLSVASASATPLSIVDGDGTKTGNNGLALEEQSNRGAWSALAFDDPIAAIPVSEPTTLLLFGTGLTMLAAWRMRHRTR